MVEQLRTAFTRLTGAPVEPERRPPSSFRFRWGGERGEEEEGGWDGPSLSHTVLDTVVKNGKGGETAVNEAYWHPPLRKCKSWYCSHDALLPPPPPETRTHARTWHAHMRTHT